MQSMTHDDRSWEAFRYVYGEMTEEDRRAFELRLADDESLCDEVEQAVELNEAIRLASPEPIRVRHLAWDALPLRRVMWGAALAASVLLAMFIGRAVSIRRAQPEAVAPLAGTSPGEPPGGVEGRGVEERSVEAGVSLVWADLRRRDADGAATEPWTGPTGRWAGPAAVAEVEELPAGLEDPAEGMPPQWLLTAVAGGSNDTKETP